jgi:hypothetical protein
MLHQENPYGCLAVDGFDLQLSGQYYQIGVLTVPGLRLLKQFSLERARSNSFWQSLWRGNGASLL